jgi:hypothetical protein
MAETQAAPPREGSALEEEIAAAIALILAGTVVPSRPPVEVIAGLLALIPGLPDEARESPVTERIARLVLRRPGSPKRSHRKR